VILDRASFPLAADEARFPLPRRLVDREAFILDRCRGKRVLDIGCIDHPFLEARLADGSWLHAKIVAVAREVVGVDSAERDMAAVRGRPDVGRMIVGDAERLDALALEPFEVVVAGEIMEHLNNPGLFLASAHTVLAAQGELVISVPNAFCLRRLLRIPSGYEKVHPDHVAYYSHATLSRLLRRAGYQIESSAAYRLPPAGHRAAYLLDRLASFVSPNLCEGLVYSAAARPR
jgi:2-polyprenyl-3-methyl-5-hydroxy-6-metoxy-1,4-benzoquinol methylase